MKVKDEEKNIKKVETQNKIVKTNHENTDNLAESKEEIKKDVKIETKQKGLEKDVETETKQKEIKKDAKIEKKQKKTVFFVVKSVENVYNKSFINDIVA